MLTVISSLVLYVCFVDRCLSLCTFVFWPLCCLFFFDILIRISPLVSSNSSIHFNIYRTRKICSSNLQKFACKNLIEHVLYFSYLTKTSSHPRNKTGCYAQRQTVSAANQPEQFDFEYFLYMSNKANRSSYLTEYLCLR